MIPSTELRALILQWYASISSGDMLGFAERLFSRQEGLLTIGSDPTEWWEGFEAILGAYRATASRGSLEIKVDDLT